MDKHLKLKLVSCAVIAALSQMSIASAEEAAVDPAVEQVNKVAATEAVPTQVVNADEAEPTAAPLNLDRVVVTGTAKKISKMKSSVSISTKSLKQVQQTGATNAAEILRSIPGVRAESSGGEGNANMTVRGLPISAGGSRYFQMQEDGLPILQFGDIAFATPDMFMRVDFGLKSLEVIRGGSGSTVGTNSPGGIVNFINQTGERASAKIGFSSGLNFNEYRTDFAVGGPLGDTGLRGFVSGYYRQGDGLRDPGFTMAEGGQIKGNVTKEIDNGYIRLSFKHLDDQTPVNMPVPITTDARGNISTIPGINPRDVSFYSRAWPKDTTLTGNNGSTTNDPNDGMTVKTDSVGAEFSYDFANGFNVTNKFRYANNRGRFMGIFPNSGVTNGLVDAVLFNTSNDMDLLVNDINLSTSFDTGAAKFTPSIGLFYSKQDVDLTWSFNQYRISAQNAPSSVTFVNGSTTTFGGCCTRDIDAEYTTTSPYVSLGLEMGSLNADVSVRRDNQEAKGSYSQAVANGGLGVFATRNRVDYDIDETSYSAGANYTINKNLAVFGRISRGYAFNADRIMFGSANLDGGTIPVNEVKQYEAGVKWRQGNLNTFITLFKADTDESNFDATTQISTSNTYDTKGVEFEAGYSIGHFNIGAGATYTDAEVTKSPGNPGLVGNSPNRQAKWIYQLTPTFNMNKWTVGSSIIGTSSSIDNRNGATGQGVTMDGFAVVNGFINYQYDKKLLLSLSANNLFDKIGFTEAQGNVARSVDGRTVRANVIYTF
jgi:outer membrane receptor protein involved in Fe transport